jgi:hypothetical protein
MAEQKPKPDQPSSAHSEMAPDLRMLRALSSGTQAMRAARDTYLPKAEHESDPHYEARLTSTFLHPGFADAVRTSADLPFRKPVTIGEDSDPDLVAIADDVDMRHRNITQFARDVMEDGCEAGLSHILVEFPVVDRQVVRTLADEKRLGLRPYFVHIKAENLLAAYTTMINGRSVVTEARFLEESIDTDGAFGERRARRVRHYKSDVIDIWVEDGDDWRLEDSTPNSLGFVPLVTLYAGKKRRDYVVKPLFLDLAHKNIEHWQSSSEQRNILRYGRFAMLAVSGMDGDEKNPIKIGPSRILGTPDPHGKWYYVEPQGSAIDLGFKDLQRIEDQMRMLSLKAHRPDDGKNDVTATEAMLTERKVTTPIQQVALNLQDTLRIAFWYAGRWMGKADANIDLSIDTEFELPFDAGDFEKVQAMRARGDLSRNTLWAEAQRRGILGQQFDAEKEAELIEAEGPALDADLGSGIEDGDQDEDNEDEAKAA